MAKTDEYRAFIKAEEHFKFPADVMAKIKAHNPTYTKVATSTIWDKVFRRSVKKDENSFKLKTGNNQYSWYFDVSQTMGKPVPVIYQNVSGKVESYQQILDCLTKYSTRQVVFHNGKDYCAGIGQDSYVQDDEIILRTGLSEQQVIFAIVREIIRQNHESAIVVEAASYIVCRLLNIDTSIFSFGYLLELLDFDVTIKAFDTTIQETVANETTIFAEYLYANLPFLQNTAPSGEDIQPSTDIDHRIVKILGNFSDTLPDKGIDMDSVRKYGYTDEKMLPIRHVAAERLFSKGREVYMLYKNNSEVQVENKDEITKHRGYFGISADDWMAAKIQMLQDSIGTATVAINSWSKLANVSEQKEDEKISQNSETQTSENDKKQMDALTVNANGSVVIVSDDINFSDIENEVWLETALPDLLNQPNFNEKDVPYFASKNAVVCTVHKKINALMLEHCVKCITWAIKKYRNKVPETKNYTHDISTAVAHVYSTFTYKHIIEVLDKHRAEIKAPASMKLRFEQCLIAYHKVHRNRTKKSTPEDDFKRHATNSNGSDETTQDNHTSNDRTLEIRSIIETYNKQINEKRPKADPNKMPSMSHTARKKQ